MDDEGNKIGIVVPEDPNIVGWDKNLDIAHKILSKLNFEKKLTDNFIFPIGAMFIARCDAIKYIANPAILNLEYPIEPVPRDGTILHAIERLIGFPKAPFEVAAAYLEGTKR
jgi:lipopolysaccharide biosynthesis protein